MRGRSSTEGMGPKGGQDPMEVWQESWGHLLEMLGSLPYLHILAFLSVAPCLLPLGCLLEAEPASTSMLLPTADTGHNETEGTRGQEEGGEGGV